NNSEKVLIAEVEAVEPRPYIEGIPLDEEVLDYLYEQAVENDFSYELLLGLMKTESDFDVNAKSHTSDSGLLQLHRPTAKWIGEELEVDKINMFDPYMNIDFAIFYLNHVRDYWRQQDVSEEELYFLTV